MNFDILKYKKIFVLSFVVLCLSILPAFAQNELSIGVAPTSKIVKLKPGETYSDDIVFWNLSSVTHTYNIYVRGFNQIENQPGTAIILTEEEDEKALYSASKWITLDREEIELEPNKNTKLKYTITVPNDVTKGEYNVQIFLVSKTAEQSMGNVAFANLASGMPLLVQIGDEFVENAELLRFATDNSLYERINISFHTTIKNLGDTHITPVGDIVIENMFKQEVARIPFNNNRHSLLRDNVGNYIDNWSQQGYLSNNRVLAVGPMKARMIVTYRNFQPGFATLTEETTFWVIPWKIIIGIFVGLLTVIIVVKGKKRLQRK
jgi:hypothetical protein